MHFLSMFSVKRDNRLSSLFSLFEMIKSVRSPYIFSVNYHEKECRLLFNTQNSKLAALPYPNTRLSPKNRQVLAEQGFFTVPATSEPATGNDKDIVLSLETSLACNLDCPYCYQKTKDIDKTDHLDFGFIAEYITHSFCNLGISVVHLKVLGGEPSLSYASLLAFLKSLQDLRARGLRLYLYIDTNATLLHLFNDFDSLVDSLAFNVPLCHKSVHDRERCDGHGNGTYESIINNIMAYHGRYPEARFVIRHNTNDNYRFFFDFCNDIAIRVPFSFINVCYTVESKDYSNPLSYPDYIKWLYTSAIPYIWKKGLPVLNSPVVKMRPCQFYQEGSYKFFSDGTVGRCAGDDWKDRVPVDVFRENGYRINKNTRKIADQCLDCPDLYICPESQRFPCRALLKAEKCLYKKFEKIILTDYLKLLYESHLEGEPERFAGLYGTEYLI